MPKINQNQSSQKVAELAGEEGGFFSLNIASQVCTSFFKYNNISDKEKNQWEVVSELAIMAQKLLNVGSLWIILQCIVGELAGGGSVAVAVAVAVNDIWHVTCDTWNLTPDTSNLTPDTSPLTPHNRPLIKKKCVCASICICWEIQCLPYTGFLLKIIINDSNDLHVAIYYFSAMGEGGFQISDFFLQVAKDGSVFCRFFMTKGGGMRGGGV